MNALFRGSRLLRAARPMPTPAPTLRRTLITLEKKKLYTGYATVRPSSADGTIAILDKGSEAGVELPMAVPSSLGGSGRGHNPEQLLAAGHASCFLMTMQHLAAEQGRSAEIADVVIHAEGVLGKPVDRPGWGFAVNLKVEGVAQEWVDAAHEACPWSRMEKEGIVVNVARA